MDLWLKRNEFRKVVDKELAALKKFDEGKHVHMLEHACFAKPHILKLLVHNEESTQQAYKLELANL